MLNPFQRLTIITGSEAAEALKKSRVIIVGLGGVGSWCAEALVRSGIGNISIVDFDTVCVSNINRQVQASSRSVSRMKTGALEERLKEINPACNIRSFQEFFPGEAPDHFEISGADFVIDAIDILESKLDLMETALAAGKKLFSSMGMARKLDPTLIKTADIWETRGCPLARLVRHGLKKRNCTGHFTAVYSPERLPQLEAAEGSDNQIDTPDSRSTFWYNRKTINGSCVTVTATAGMVLASLVIRDLYTKYCGLSPQAGGPGG